MSVNLAGSNPGNVMVVDDTPANLQVLCAMLNERGYHLRPVPSGKLALHAAQIEPPDLVLLDINMPEMNGYEVCMRLKADEKLKDIPVIFISALTETLDKIKAFSIGGVDYVTKPFQVEEVQARVETHLRIRRFQQQIQAQTETERSLLNAAPSAGILVDTLGVIITLNELGANELAAGTRPVDQLSGQCIWDLLPSSAAQPCRDSLARVVNSGRPERFEMQWQARVMDATIYPLYNPAGLVERVALHLLDITARKRADEEMRMALEQERELSELKERFISMVAHEYRTPLAIILSSTEMLEHYSDRISADKRQARFLEIQKQINYMIDLLDDVLTISRSRRGKLSFDPKPMEVETFCRAVFEQLQDADDGRHRFSFSCDGQAGQACLDERLLRHTFINLLSNAMRYSPPGTEIRLDVHCDGASHLEFCFRDQGIGIPASDMAHLFEPFHRAGNVGEIRGTGLGLSIVKASVERHGGSISVESVENRGTTFTVRIPLARDCLSAS